MHVRIYNSTQTQRERMETTVVYWGYITPIMENQMEKNMETGVLYERERARGWEGGSERESLGFRV